MEAMAMTPQQYSEFQRLKKDVEELKVSNKVLQGNWEELNAKIDKILSLVKGIAIGVAIGAVIFGLLSIKDFISLVK